MRWQNRGRQSRSGALENVVAADEDLAQGADRLAVLELFGICELRDEVTWSALCCTVQRDRSRRVERAHLEVHVVVGRDEVALVLHPPLEADEDGLAREVREERLGVDGLYGVGVLMEEEAVMGGGGGEGEGEGRGRRARSRGQGQLSVTGTAEGCECSPGQTWLSGRGVAEGGGTNSASSSPPPRTSSALSLLT